MHNFKRLIFCITCRVFFLAPPLPHRRLITKRTGACAALPPQSPLSCRAERTYRTTLHSKISKSQWCDIWTRNVFVIVIYYLKLITVSVWLMWYKVEFYLCPDRADTVASRLGDSVNNSWIYSACVIVALLRFNAVKRSLTLIGHRKNFSYSWSRRVNVIIGRFVSDYVAKQVVMWLVPFSAVVFHGFFSFATKTSLVCIESHFFERL